jgi:hypothetical protein
MTTTTTRRLPLAVRAEIISYLVKQEHPATAEEANELALQWNECSDEDLIQANNYNRQANGLPAKLFERGEA